MYTFLLSYKKINYTVIVGRKILPKLSFPSLNLTYQQILERKTKIQSLKYLCYLITYEAVCRDAPVTSGLLIFYHILKLIFNEFSVSRHVMRISPEFQYCLFLRLVSEHIFSWA